MSRGELTVTIATPLEDELVRRIAAVPDVTVRYDASLVPPPRWPADHVGDPSFRRDAAAERRFGSLLAGADVVLGIPGESPAALAAAVRGAPRLRWLQAMAAGAGEQVRAAGLSRADLERVVFTSASGVHAVPLAEFCLFGLLAFYRGLPDIEANARERGWTVPVPHELGGRTLLLVGVGAIGAEVARLANAFGMHVVGVSRRGAPVAGVAAVHTPERLADLAAEADAIVVTLPLTDETQGLVGRDVLERLPRGAVFVNVGRGRVADEEALVDALRDGRLRGAALDVFATEPLPAESPLWQLPNVIVSPHTAARSRRENERIVALFVDNLGRFRRGERLRSVVDTERFY